MSKENTLLQTDVINTTSSGIKNIGIFQFEVDSNKVYWNDVLKTIHEVPTDYYPSSKNIYGECKEGESKEQIIKCHATAISKGIPFELDHDIITLKGKTKYLRTYGQPVFNKGKCISIHGVSIDITERKHLELEIKQKNSQLNKAAQIVKSGYWRWNPINNKEFWSDSLYDMFEHPKGTVSTDETYLSYVHPLDIDFVNQHLDNALKTKTFPDYQHRILLKSGKIKTILAKGEVITNSDGEIIEFVGTCQDLTEIKSKEQELTQKNLQLNIAEKLSNSGSWNWNIEDNTVTWTDNLYNIFQHDKNEPVNFNVYTEYIYEEDKAYVINNFKTAKNTKKYGSIMYRIRLKDGSVKTLKSSGQVTTNKLGEAISIIGTCQDITDRTAKEQELLQRNQQLELTENTNEAGTWSWNPITGMFKWSENLYEIMDFDKNIPMNFEVLYTRIHPEDKHIVDNSMQLVQDTGLKHTFTHRIIINDGSIRTLEIIADIISNKANNQPEFIGTARDITSTLNIAQELNQKDQLLNFSEQLTTMGYWKYKPSMNDVYWSDNLYHIFDQSKKDDLTFETYFHKVHPDDKNFVKKRILQSIKDNKFYDFTHRIILKNNKIRVIQIIGKVTVNKIDGLQELLGTCLDITESHSKDLELSEKNYRLNVAEKMAMIGYWQWKTPINEVFWSDNLHAIYGHDKREPLTFETYINYVHKEDRKTVVANLKTAMKTGEFLESTYRIQLDDGSIKVIKSVGKITLDSKGEVLEMSGTCQDITEVKKKELALLQKNQQFNFAEKIANIGSWQWNPNTNKANWSDNHYRLYGIEIGTPLDLQTIYNQIHPDDLDPLKELTQEILSNKKFTETRFRIQLQSGDIKTLEVIGEVITDKAGSIVLLKGTSQDITYRIKAEQQIQEKNQLLSYAEEIAMMGSWHFDVHTNNLKWSDNLYKIYDLEVNSPMSMDIFYSKIHPDDIEIVKDQVQKCIEGDENIKSIFFRIILNNGKILSIESIAGITKNYLGEVVEIAGTAQDITERLKIEKDILEKNQLLNFTEQLSSIGHWKWDILQDVMEKSENLLKILDFEPEAKLDFNTYLKRVHPADREKVIDISQRIIETQKFNTFHHRIIMDDNSIKTIKIIGEVILDIDGNVIELIGSSQDITEQIEAQQKILDTNRSLEKSTITLTSKNKQLAEFNHITSHNLRSPVSNLNALLGLYRSTKNEDKKVEIFDKFEIVIDHLTETLNALIETISIKHSANEITKELCFEQTLLKTKEILAAELIESSAKISCDFSKAKNVKYNPIYLESIFLNLVSNSLKYRSEDRVPEISITSNTVNGRITLEFEDNGLGIDMKSNGHKLFGLNKVFHKHPDAKGIGLFLTKAQIIAMGGSISAKSKVGVGTTFFIILN